MPDQHPHLGFPKLALGSESRDQPGSFPTVEPVLKLADFGLVLVLQPGEMAEGLARVAHVHGS